MKLKQGTHDTHRNALDLLRCNTLQHAATRCNVLQPTAAHYSTPQYTAVHCSTLQQITNTLEHAATH